MFQSITWHHNVMCHVTKCHSTAMCHITKCDTSQYCNVPCCEVECYNIPRWQITNLDVSRNLVCYVTQVWHHISEGFSVALYFMAYASKVWFSMSKPEDRVIKTLPNGLVPTSQRQRTLISTASVSQ
jgi:hypothetical protein